MVNAPFFCIVIFRGNFSNGVPPGWAELPAFDQPGRIILAPVLYPINPIKW
jgi:hypothetical protein